MAKTKNTKAIKNQKAKQVKSSPVKAKSALSPKKATKPKSGKKVAVAKPAATAKKTTARPAVIERNVNTNKKKKGSLSLREERIQQIKMTLLKQREALLNEAESSLNELPGQTIYPDLGDQASAETDRNFMLRLRGREQRLLKKIDEAVDRIDAGTFGICDDCGNEIDVKRLEARPVTTMCIECKTIQEEEEKLREG
ncbi:MAG: RNA polymerase-binding protein DksA [Nitrospirae bacterium]|nr:RNA polymerase-binding protein DksA [Nitrospirota bacterium]